MAGMGAAFGKKKWTAFKLGKGSILLGGLVCSGHIALMLPSVLNYILPKEQQSTMNSIARVTTNYTIACNVCLGVSYLLTMPNMDVSSIIQSVKAGVFTYGVLFSLELYHYKYYPDAFKTWFHFVGLGVNGGLLALSLYSNMKMEGAFPKNQAIRSFATMSKKKKRRQVKKSTAEMKGSDADVEDNDENEAIFHKKGMTYWAQYYREGVHELTIELGPDDLFQIRHAGICVAESSKAKFKISQQVKSVVLEKCEDVSVEIASEVLSIDMVNCKKCTIFVRKKGGIISVENCESPKVVLFNAAVKSKPSIMSSNAVNFEIDVQKEDKEESDWKSVMVPFQLKTEINPESFSAITSTVRL